MIRSPHVPRASRGQSTSLEYVLVVGITTLLVIGLVFSAGGYVEDQRERAIRTELEVLGQQVAADVAAGDRLVREGVTDFNLSRNLPETVAGVTYTVAIEVDDPGNAPSRDTFVRLTTSDPDVTVDVDMALETDVAEGSVDGREIRVTFDTAADQLVIEND
jgi:hypothetical protein